jgi:hypothetical protein
MFSRQPQAFHDGSLAIAQSAAAMIAVTLDPYCGGRYKYSGTVGCGELIAGEIDRSDHAGPSPPEKIRTVSTAFLVIATF